MTINAAGQTKLTTAEILALVQSGKLKPAEAVAMLDAAKATGGGQAASLKVSEKGCVQFRGVPGISIRFGLSLYPKTIEWILDNADALREFIKNNHSKLSWSKAQSDEKSAA